MSYKITRNGIDYPIKDGFVLKDELNEKLDSGTIIFETTSKIEDLDCFDEITISGDNMPNRIMLIDNFICNQTQFEPNELYEYTINLFSETKALERIALPSLSITKSMIEGEIKTVYEYITRYCAFYLPKIKVLNGDDWQYVDEYTLDENLINKFNMECPEFSWNDPTLKEVLDDLMMVNDCICVVKNHVITYLDLTKKKKTIDKTKLNLISTSKGSADSISDLVITMKNSIGKNVVNTIEHISLRSDGGEITTENAAFYTQHPIYNLKKVLACYLQPYAAASTGGVATHAYVEVDITPLIVEKSVFDTLLPDDMVFSFGFDLNEAKKYQKFNLYYTRNNNKIENWGSVKFFQTTYQYVLLICANADTSIRNRFSSTGLFLTANGMPDLRNITFKIEYDTLDERKMKVGKYLPTNHYNNEIFDNQTSSYVDAKNQSIFEYAKANRLGNLITTIYGVYNSENEVPELGDYLDNSILFSREISYYDNYILFKGMLTENYILKNYFTGVQSKRRSYQIALGSEALTRIDITKFYCEFSFNKKTEKFTKLDKEFDNTIFFKYLATPIYNDDLKIIKYCMVLFDGANGRIPSISDGYAYQMDLNVEIQGMSLCFNFGFDDNYAAGYYAYKQDNLYRTGIYRYTDDNGEFNLMRIRFNTYIDPTDGRFEMPNNLDEVLNNYDTMSNSLAVMGRRKPLVLISNRDYNVLGLTIPNYYKDNREIIKHVVQFEYCADTKDIIITKKFLEYQRAIYGYAITCKVFTSSNSKEKYNNSSTAPFGKENGSIRITFDNYTAMIECVFLQTTLISNWAITDGNNNLLIGVNEKLGSAFKKAIYLNLLENRDDNIYNNNEERIIVGKMKDYN